MVYKLRMLSAYFSALSALKLGPDDRRQLAPTRDLVVSEASDLRDKGFTAVEAGVLLLASVLNVSVREGTLGHDRAILYAREVALWASSHKCSAAVALAVSELRVPSG